MAATVTLNILDGRPVSGGIMAWHRIEEARDGSSLAVSYLRVVHKDPGAVAGTMQSDKGNVTTATVGNKADAGEIKFPSGKRMPSTLNLSVYGPIFDEDGNPMTFPVKPAKERK